jgi:hypothetical protein
MAAADRYVAGYFCWSSLKGHCRPHGLRNELGRGLGRLVAYAVDEDLDKCGAVGGRFLVPDPRRGRRPPDAVMTQSWLGARDRGQQADCVPVNPTRVLTGHCRPTV